MFLWLCSGCQEYRGVPLFLLLFADGGLGPERHLGYRRQRWGWLGPGRVQPWSGPHMVWFQTFCTLKTYWRSQITSMSHISVFTMLEVSIEKLKNINSFKLQ